VAFAPLLPPLFVIRSIEGGGDVATSQRERSRQDEARPASEEHFARGGALDDARSAGARSRSGATGRGRQGVRQASAFASSDRVLKVTSRGDRGAPALPHRITGAPVGGDVGVLGSSYRVAPCIGESSWGNLRRGRESATRACGATHHHHRARHRLSPRPSSILTAVGLRGFAPQGLPRSGPHRGNHGHLAPSPPTISTHLAEHDPLLTSRAKRAKRGHAQARPDPPALS